jgi:hypothetical protein
MSDLPRAESRAGSSGDTLLVAGALSGAVFYGLIIGQAVLRPGFDILHHPISLLTLGEAGWIQRVAFAVAGLLVLLGVRGMSVSNAGEGARSRWIPILLSLFGLGTILAGLFVPDPAFGFPPGTPDVAPATMSTASIIHGLSFDVAFLALIVATFVSARGSIREGDRGAARFSIGLGLVMPIVIVMGFLTPSWMGACFFLAGALAFVWVTVTFLRARRAVAA